MILNLELAKNSLQNKGDSHSKTPLLEPCFIASWRLFTSIAMRLMCYISSVLFYYSVVSKLRYLLVKFTAPRFGAVKSSPPAGPVFVGKQELVTSNKVSEVQVESGANNE